MNFRSLRNRKRADGCMSRKENPEKGKGRGGYSGEDKNHTCQKVIQRANIPCDQDKRCTEKQGLIYHAEVLV